MLKFFIIFFIMYILLFFLIIFVNNKEKKHKKELKCDEHSCGALDPVSDPVYNMHQIVKQSILLEEHLTNKNKRCRDCITKHFLHIIGLAEEAQMLATKNKKNYPLLDENVVLYNNLFAMWYNNHDDINDDKILYITDMLRNNRKKLIAIYFFNDTYKIKSLKTYS